MTLVDTSVWFDHFRMPVASLQRLLIDEEVSMHRSVLGEIAMGKWKQRADTLADLRKLDLVVHARDEEVLQFVQEKRLFGSGIGYIDAHLLAAARITPACDLWTRDKRLKKAAIDLGIASPLI